MVLATLILLLATAPTGSEAVPILQVAHWSGPLCNLHVDFYTDGRVERSFSSGYTHATRLDPRDRYRLMKYIESPDFGAALRGLDAMHGPERTCTEDVSIRFRSDLHGYTIPTDCPSSEVIDFIRLLNDIMTRSIGADAELPIEMLIC